MISWQTNIKYAQTELFKLRTPNIPPLLALLVSVTWANTVNNVWRVCVCVFEVSSATVWSKPPPESSRSPTSKLDVTESDQSIRLYPMASLLGAHISIWFLLLVSLYLLLPKLMLQVVLVLKIAVWTLFLCWVPQGGRHDTLCPLVPPPLFFPPICLAFHPVLSVTVSKN